jgi:hypothetical protein
MRLLHFIKRCKKADNLLKSLYEPIGTLTKIIVQLFVIVGIVLFIISPSINNSLLLVPFLMSIIGKYKIST